VQRGCTCDLNFSLARLSKRTPWTEVI